VNRAPLATERMAPHYSTINFLRQMPNALLARYFQARRLFGEIDFSRMKETKPDEELRQTRPDALHVAVVWCWRTGMMARACRTPPRCPPEIAIVDCSVATNPRGRPLDDPHSTLPDAVALFIAAS
jgi:hypothetical protein